MTSLVRSAPVICAAAWLGCSPAAPVPPRPRALPPATPVVAAAAPALPDLAYAVRRVPRGEGFALEVSLAFTGGATGRTVLELPHQWAGQEDLDTGIEALELLTPGASLEEGEARWTRTLVHPRGARLALRYRVHETPSAREHERAYRPILAPEYFHFMGEAVFAYPRRDENAAEHLTLDWLDLPAGWTLADSFGAGESHQALTSRVDLFRHAIFVGGDFRMTRIDVRGSPVVVALRGEWKFKDEEFAGLVGSLMNAERSFWNDFDFPYFLVTLIPTGARCCSYGGTGLTASFATFVATDKPLEERMSYLLAHELFHSWNGRKITRQEPERLVYWFSEGFTDYYARLLRLRAGLLDVDGYIADLDRKLFAFATSPAAGAPNQRVLDAFWKDEAVEHLPYQRGDILAHNWNAAIRQATGGRSSIDDVMRDLLAAAQLEGTVVSAGTLDALVRPYLPGGIADDLARYVDAGEALAPRPDALGPCAELTTRQMAVFDPGFDLGGLDRERVVRGTRKDGSAYRAGVRDGQQVVSWHAHFNDAETPIVLEIQAGKKPRTIRYLPEGAKLPVPQFVAVHPRPAACATWLGLPTP